MRRILVTGGCGFIGSNLVRHLLRTHADVEVVNLDALTYAGNPANLADLSGEPRYRFIRGDITDARLVAALMPGCWGVAHLAAETHVDRSLLDGGDFIRTNVLGTYTLLRAALDAGVQRFLHVSTDEVYGPTPHGLAFREDQPFSPRSPYAASKAGAEFQVRAFFESYGLPAVVTRGVNTVGPYQHLEKVVPLFTTNALLGLPLPLYGDGLQARDRLFVEDHCRAIDLVLHEGEPGEAYNVAAGNEAINRLVAEMILDALDLSHDLIRPVEDRAGHDERYALDAGRLHALGWAPTRDLEQVIADTVEWYRHNDAWWRLLRNPAFQRYYERQYGARLAERSG
ncbi:MAG: dTDP-glucose 4,6-dehydratase [Dehalococcoidia bacterium]